MKVPLEFDSVRTPLKNGINLIEASAGTGKTFAVAMLVLRAVTEENVRLERVLVVTYTKAAVAELRERIRLRLAQARNLLQGRSCVEDQVLSEWIETFSEDQKKRQQYLARLQLALTEIDRASVFTIHGFCQRMLQEQALEAGQLFDVELLTSLDKQYKKASEKFWRKHFYNLTPWQCSLLMSLYKSPADLLRLKGMVQGKDVLFEPVLPKSDQLWQSLEESVEGVKKWWRLSGTTFVEQFQRFCTEEKFKKDFRGECPGVLKSMADFFSGNSDKYPQKMSLLLPENVITEINSRKVKKAEKEAFVDSLVLPATELEQLLHTQNNLLTAFRIFSYSEIESIVEALLETESAASFDQLITGLSKGLAGEQGVSLKNILQDRFDFALVDEFQDTDADQWSIFSTIFATNNHRLYLIGDPKQAIYKFRGADIFSYFAARSEATHFYSLSRNYRSHPELVDAVNNLFSSCDDSFLFAEKGINYQKVQPAKDGSSYLVDDNNKHIPPFSYCVLEEQLDKKGKPTSWTSGNADKVILKNIVEKCLALITPGTGAYVAYEKDSEANRQQLLPKDIAILVRSHSQAEKYQKAMVHHGIPAVIAGKNSVFNSLECQELLLLLKSIQEFENFKLLKSCMTTSLFGLTGDDLYSLWQDTVAVAEWYDVFAECNRVWREKGVLQMLYYLVEEKQLFNNLASLPFAERRIANYTHLFELVQGAETEKNYGPRQTILWLQNCLTSGDRNEEVELRLESDEDALQIVTIHSSKGLQYPVVFCPDLFKRSARLKHEKNIVVCHDEQTVVDFGSEKFEERKNIARQEELAEDLRLLYVTLTRAELGCYCFWADVKASGVATDSSFASALGYLLFDNIKIDSMEQEARLGELGSPVNVLSDIEITGFYQKELSDELLKVKQVSERSLKTDYQVSSYSALAALSDHADIAHSLKPRSVSIENQTPYAELPKGARFGNCVHDVLEELAFEEIGLGSGSHKLRELLEKKCQYYGVEAELDLLEAMLADTVNSPLTVEGGNTFSLSDLSDKSCLKEMQFYLHLVHMSVSEINKILQHEATVQNLGEKQLQGYMTGFVDLVCMHNEKYYVIDYKSNYLGETWGDYGMDDLTRAMASHNYGLQYYIYSLVLHQHLKAFMPDYSYEHDFGGVIYLFLRGMNPNLAGCGVFTDRPDESLILQLDELVTQGGR